MHYFALKYFIVLIIILCNGLLSNAQNQGNEGNLNRPVSANNKVEPANNGKAILQVQSDTVAIKKHSPTKAAWMSAVLPGLGQVYNRNYWKVPVIYVGLGIFSYLGYNYYTKFHEYKSTYMLRSNIDPNSKDYYPEITSEEILYNNFSYYRRNFELTCIFGSLFYVLNIIDASVDAHLFKFDVSEELTLRFEPALINYNYTGYNNPSTGLKISLNF